MNTSSEPSETFQKGSGRSFATADVKILIFWAAYFGWPERNRESVALRLTQQVESLF